MEVRPHDANADNDHRLLAGGGRKLSNAFRAGLDRTFHQVGLPVGCGAKRTDFERPRGLRTNDYGRSQQIRDCRRPMARVPRMPWWRDAVIYQIYPRSFQDSDGDGVGDLAGIESRLDHVARLGASAVWLSPIYPSPLADFGYDVSDYLAVDPVYGDLQGFDRLLASGPRAGHAAADGPGAVPHLDRAPLVQRAPRLVHLGRRARRGPAQQLARHLRRARRGPGTRAAGAGTCTRSIPSSPTWTGATRNW